MFTGFLRTRDTLMCNGNRGLTGHLKIPREAILELHKAAWVRFLSELRIITGGADIE